MRFHHNLHIMIQRYQEAQQALHGELAEGAAQHLRDIGLADSEHIGRFHLPEAPFLQDCVKLEYELRFDEMLLGAGYADAFENVAASGFASFFVAHCSPRASCSGVTSVTDMKSSYAEH